MTQAERDRQAVTAQRMLRLERTRTRGDDPTPPPVLRIPGDFEPGEEAALRTFLDKPEHARALRAHVERCRTGVEELRLAWAYRATLGDVPGAWPAWIELCRSLGA